MDGEGRVVVDCKEKRKVEKLPRIDGEEAGASILNRIIPLCRDAGVVGSIRRGEKYVKDLDIVCQPDVVKEPKIVDMFGMVHEWEYTNMVSKLVREGGLDEIMEVKSVSEKMIKGKMIGNGLPVDLWMIDDRRKWGWAMVARTGPANFSKVVAEYALMKHWHITGYLLHMHEKGGRPGSRKPCVNGSKCLLINDKTRTEGELFSALGLPMIPEYSREVEVFEQAVKMAEMKNG